MRYPIKNKHKIIMRYYRYKYRTIWKVSLLALWVYFPHVIENTSKWPHLLRPTNLTRHIPLIQGVDLQNIINPRWLWPVRHSHMGCQGRGRMTNHLQNPSPCRSTILLESRGNKRAALQRVVWRTYPRSGFWYHLSNLCARSGFGGPSFRFLYPRSGFGGPGNICQTTLSETTLLRTPDLHTQQIVGMWWCA